MGEVSLKGEEEGGQSSSQNWEASLALQRAQRGGGILGGRIC